MSGAPQAPSPTSLPWPETFTLYLDVLQAEYRQAEVELYSAELDMGKPHTSQEGSDASLDALERAGHLRNVAWTMLVQARALLGVS